MLTAPATSKLRVSASERLSAIRIGAMAAAITPIGTLTHSTHSQPRPSVSAPPSSTPAAPPLPATAPHTPSALLRSAPSRKVVATIESAAGERIAAPRPWTARAAISCPELLASPPASEARAKSTSPNMKTRRRPSRSARRPPSRRKPPKVSTEAFTTQGRPLSLKSSASPIVGRATLTIEASSTTTNWAVQSRASAIQRLSRAAVASVIGRSPSRRRISHRLPRLFSNRAVLPAALSRGREEFGEQPLDRLRRVGEGPVSARRQHVHLCRRERLALALRVGRRQVGVVFAPDHQRRDLALGEDPHQPLRHCAGVVGRPVERQYRLAGAAVEVVVHRFDEVPRQPARLLAVEQEAEGAPGRRRLQELAEER